MPDDSSMRTVLVALGSGLAVALAKAAVAGPRHRVGHERESEAVYRVDIVPIGGASA